MGLTCWSSSWVLVFHAHSGAAAAAAAVAGALHGVQLALLGQMQTPWPTVSMEGRGASCWLHGELITMITISDAELHFAGLGLACSRLSEHGLQPTSGRPPGAQDVCGCHATLALQSVMPSACVQAPHSEPRGGMQLAGRGVVADTFSLCFGGVEGDGALMLGNVDPALYGISLAHTALVPSPDHPHYYCLQLEGLAVDGALLPLPAVRAWQGMGAALMGCACGC